MAPPKAGGGCRKLTCVVAPPEAANRIAKREPPSRAKPQPGPFGDAVLQRLKTAPHGILDHVLIMEMLHATPEDRFNPPGEGHSERHTLLFNLIIGRHTVTLTP
jgi:hypothetical protein